MAIQWLKHCVPCVVVHYPVGIWLMASAEYMGGVPTPQRCSAALSVYRQCDLRGEAVKSNTIFNYYTKGGTSVAMHNATVQQSPNSNPTIMMLQVELRFLSVKTMSFHSIVHVRHSLNHWWRKCLRFPVKGK
ncbi:hypothetical protein TNCV_2781881 [Trichonephila clavipes]|nr:hypothetical protein TNCV_2781881 [Trichonephila clavipes]